MTPVTLISEKHSYRQSPELSLSINCPTETLINRSTDQRKAGEQEASWGAGRRLLMPSGRSEARRGLGDGDPTEADPT